MKLTGIPMVPSMNMAYPTNRKTGRRFKSKEFVQWERDFHIWCLSHAPQVNEARREFSHPIRGKIVVVHTNYFFTRESILCLDGRPKKNDTSNRLKILHDAVSSAIWLDDSYFFDGTFTKRPLPGYTLKTQEFCNVDLQWVEATWMLPENSVG